MPETFRIADAAELAVVERNGFVESRHAGSAVVLAADGAEVLRLGDPAAPILPRSSLKPLQAVAALTAGAELDDVQRGLATASHTGTDRHADVVRGILQSVELTEDALQCPAAWPNDVETRDALVRDHSPKTRVRMECSGKHAAMLAACRASGWDVDGYLEIDHPFQVHVRETVERLSGERPAVTAIDGCGAPVHAVSLIGLARGIHRLATASERSPFAMHRLGAQLVRAVRENPWTIAGPGTADTTLITSLGVFAKRGAEGVMIMAAPDGTTAALKVLDGSPRAASAVAVRLLERAGALTADAAAAAIRSLDLVVRGGGAPVGAIRPTV
ncbi:MAG: asparaginase [Microbacterium ginsengisoli]|uniref:asparaginase n=2 Tax=Microbacteriaceae TaxID=85023 RepID=UPI0006FF5026|nr:MULTISPECIES: asparaginase [unclassified Microbacterium]KQR92866.1 asparaginase [Microbacterium sp. Leaf347]MBN9198889.1 asparaginase [Microbacterium ginsengisoli]OJU76118.1 MAG: asparaginase [Microbacterium sp. 71-23]